MSQTQNAAIAVVGIDIGKNSFHIVGHDERPSSRYGPRAMVRAIAVTRRWQNRGQFNPGFLGWPHRVKS